MIDDETQEFFEKLIQKQDLHNYLLIFSVFLFAFGFSVFFVAQSTLVTAYTVDDAGYPFLKNLADSYYNWSNYSIVSGYVVLSTAIILQLFDLKSKRKRISLNKKDLRGDSTLCFCGNKLPCAIHVNESL